MDLLTNFSWLELQLATWIVLRSRLQVLCNDQCGQERNHAAGERIGELVGCGG